MATKTEAAPKEEMKAEGVEPIIEEAVDEETKALIDERLTKAAEVVRRKMMYSLGLGLIPVPLVDLGALLGMQIYMLKQLADLFDVPFNRNRAKTIIMSLLGSVVPVWAAGPLASGLKLIPVVGYTTSAISMSLTGAAATYGLGKLFTYHFAEGGSFMDCDSEKMKAAFAKRFKEGQEVAAEAKEAAAAA